MGMEEKNSLSGGCYCGAIRYELIREPGEIVICHCENCRRISGGTAVAWILGKKADFRYTRGSPRTYVSDTGATWSFCEHCGTTLTYEGRDYDESVDVSLVSLDDHPAHPPQRDANVAERLAWNPLISGD